MSGSYADEWMNPCDYSLSLQRKHTQELQDTLQADTARRGPPLYQLWQHPEPSNTDIYPVLEGVLPSGTTELIWKHNHSIPLLRSLKPQMCCDTFRRLNEYFMIVCEWSKRSDTQTTHTDNVHARVILDSVPVWIPVESPTSLCLN